MFTRELTVSNGRRCLPAVLKLLLAFTLMAVLSVCLKPAQAQDFSSSRPIRMIVAVGAGGATDLLARQLAERIAPRLGTTISVENLTGASGIIAAQTVAKAAPDGHTILIGTNTTHASNKIFIKDLPYDPIKDFAPVSLLGRTTLVLCVNPDIPVKSVGELIRYAKANPDKLTYGSGTGSARMAGEMFAVKAGVDIMSVPYRSNAQALTDLLGGRISMIFGDMSLMKQHIASNAVRALAVTNPTRSPLEPNLPTLAEAGVEGYQLAGFIAAYAPAKTPKTIVDTLNKAMVEILKDAKFAQLLLDNGIEPAPSSPEGLNSFGIEEAKRWEEVAKAAGIDPT